MSNRVLHPLLAVLRDGPIVPAHEPPHRAVWRPGASFPATRLSIQRRGSRHGSTVGVRSALDPSSYRGSTPVETPHAPFGAHADRATEGTAPSAPCRLPRSGRASGRSL